MIDRQTLRTIVVDDTVYETRWTRKFASRKSYAPSDPNRLFAVIPGVIVVISVKAGQRVRRGDPILVLEAMKMKNAITAPHDAVVKAIHASAGQMVAKNQLLVDFA